MRFSDAVPGNWRIERIDVLAEEADGSWILVPDEHPLDGQVFGKEVRRERTSP